MSLGGTRSYITNVGYNQAQQTTSISLANGVNENYDYNAQRLQLTSQTATKGETTLMSLAYSYTADQTRNGGTQTGNSGQLMDITGSIINSGIKDQVFNYDQVGRLVQASGYGVEDQWKRRYTYDRWGNRTKVESFDTGAWCTKQVVKFKLGPSGQPLTNRPTVVQDYSQCNLAVSKSMLYDAAGNTRGYGTQTLLYDGESRTAQVLNDLGGIVGQYSYDAANRRVKKIAGSVTTNYVWEGSRVIAEYNGVTGTPLAEYVYAGDRMLAREAAGAVTYYHPDRLSVRMLTDVGSNWVGTQSHEPFGEQVGERDEGSLVSKWRFTNYERDDETASDYAVNRQYTQSTGRFLQPDVVAGNATNPQSMNRYAYAINDPVNLTDPLGLLAAYGGTCYLIISGTHWYQGDDYIGTTISSVTIMCFGGGGGGAFDDGGGGGGTGGQQGHPATALSTESQGPCGSGQAPATVWAG